MCFQLLLPTTGRRLRYLPLDLPTWLMLHQQKERVQSVCRRPLVPRLCMSYYGSTTRHEGRSTDDEKKEWKDPHAILRFDAVPFRLRCYGLSEFPAMVS
jgi:hypothetical protein